MTLRTAKITLLSDADTHKLGVCLAEQIVDQAVVALTGPLGAGKTSLSKGLGAGLGVQEVIVSPTFTMLNEYTSGRIPLFHFDVYRLQENGGNAQRNGNESEFLINQIEELRQFPGVIVVEWANYLDEYLDEIDHIAINIEYEIPGADDKRTDLSWQETGRVVRLSGHGKSSKAMVDAISNVYFL